MKFLVYLLCLLALILPQTSADLKVLGPDGLKRWWNENSQYTSTSIATFGYTPWGRRIVGELKVADPPNACDYIKHQSQEFLEHKIMVAVRGDCTFVVKAHYAQLAGAKMLLVVDNLDEDINYHLMVDNTGQGETVHIPVALLSKQAGDRIIETLKANKVSVSFDFKMNKTEKAKVNLWLTSSALQSYEFVKKWDEYESKLSGVAETAIHYAHYSVSDKLENCLCNGLYCAPDPDGDRPSTGADVILEDLRQICILKEYGKETWFKYMKNYDAFCISGGNMEACSNSLLASINVNKESIRSCVVNSFDSSDPNTCKSNKFLEPEKLGMSKEGIYLFPSVNINGNTYRGNLFPVRNVVEAVCESLTSWPPICRELMPDEIEAAHPSTYLVILGICVFLAISVLLIALCYQKGLRRELDSKIRQEVSIMMEQYSALKDTGKE